jgi:hypothetical protein
VFFDGAPYRNRHHFETRAIHDQFVDADNGASGQMSAKVKGSCALAFE